MGPLVEDLFLWRNNPQSKEKSEELDTQKEVVLTMLIRLLPRVKVKRLQPKFIFTIRENESSPFTRRIFLNTQVVKLMSLVLIGLRDGGADEGYRKTSRHLLDAVVPAMAKWELNMDTHDNYRLVAAFLSASSS